MTMRHLSHKQFMIFKWSVYFLLAGNVFWYFLESKIVESLDTFSWVVVIALYEWETTRMDEEYANKLEMYGITFFRILAYIVIVYCDYEYYMQGKWLDFANATTWLVVCATLEYDVYFPGNYGSAEWKIRNYLKISLYGALFLYCMLWLTIGDDPLDFFDSFLWLLAFIVIELNIFGYEEDQQAKELKMSKKAVHS